ncbi:MAG: hypothetical protein K2Y03_06540 [Sphingomonas sp.]|nr:hypothetical protein [Sphingomonas sp.]
MRPHHALLAAALLAPVVAAADRPIPEATPVGKPQLCISRVAIANSVVRSDQVIDFVMRDRRVFRATLARPCPDLGYQRGFSYATSLDRLCASDLITVFYNSPGPQGATCALAPFQQVTLAGGWKAAR